MNENTEERRNISKPVFFMGLIIALLIGYIIGDNNQLKSLIQSYKEPTEEVINITVPLTDTVEKEDIAPAPKEESAPKVVDQNAITMVSYSHDWTEDDAQISFKNNTNQEIISFSGRMIYYSMSDEMLDYQDFSRKVNIDPGMTKRIELEGYNHEEYYAYYKSKHQYSEPKKVYKVKFQLKSFRYK